jgi:chemotaxis protein histidine kinase CheA
VGKNSAAYKSLIKSTSLVIHGIKGESASLRLLGVSRQAHIMENAMAELQQRQEVSGEDLIPVVYELSRVQEQVARIERLFKRIAGATSNSNTVPPKSIFEPTQLIAVPNDFDMADKSNLPALTMPIAYTQETEIPLPTLSPVFSLTPNNVSPRPAANVVLNQPLSDLSPLTMLFTPSVPPLDEMAVNLKKLSATVAQAVGKNVAMTYEIADIMPSGLMLRVLREVLPQLVRNSVVHGIEMPNDRLKAGKPGQGQLKLTIRRYSDAIAEVSIKDDGRGITIEAVKARLVEMNINVEDLSSGQILQHIFDVQFSTSPQVTEHAGRGVGLALVKESLEKAGAKLKVNTRPGKSTEFLMHFGGQL